MPVITVEHPSEDLLERYFNGRLTEAEVAPLEEHLLICGECRNRGC
jgi:anti-sigma factor ChrR (cupin superfamily)